MNLPGSAAMFINSETLIDETLENLRLISELLADDLDRLTHPFVSSRTVQASNTVRAIESLMPQLKLAKERLRSTTAPDMHASRPARACINCDD
jgi:hypothetical protein